MRMKQWRTWVMVVGIALVSWTGIVTAQEEAATLVPANISLGWLRAVQGMSYGWWFQATQSFTLTDLGLLDWGSDGFAGSHSMGVWHLSSGGWVQLCGPVQIDTSATPGADGKYRYIDVPDIPMTAGEEYLVAAFSVSDNTDKLIFRSNENGEAVVFNAPITILGQKWQYSSQLIAPSDNTTGYPYDEFGVNFKYMMPGPVADAGSDVAIFTSQQAVTTISGTATHTVSGTTMQYQWLEGSTVLQDWTLVGTGGAASLSLGAPMAALSRGTHTLTLKVKEAEGTTPKMASDSMILTVLNTPPTADAGGPYNVAAISLSGANVALNGTGSDFDDDTLSYAWSWANGGTASGASPTVLLPIGQTPVTLTVTDGQGGSAIATAMVTVGADTVGIDVKPGSTPNVINMGSNGVVPVAFLSSATFDATTIRLDTVALRGEDGFVAGVVRMRGKNGTVPQASLTDVNGDGRVDLLVHIETEKLADEDIQAEISLGAVTNAGKVVIGFDTVTVINQQ